ncbi:hypothetical protein ACM66B_001932 [Microbotryomycetes sp. NB124-2]
MLSSAFAHRQQEDDKTARQFGSTTAPLPLDTKTTTPWIDISYTRQAFSPAEPKPFGVLHIEQTPYGSATSVNSLGLSVDSVPAFDSLPSPEQPAHSAMPIDLPGAFEPADPSTALFGSLTTSLLGLQFDEDFDADPSFRSSPPLVPVALPRLADVEFQQRPSYTRKRVSSYFLPTPPSEDEDEPSPSFERERRQSNPIFGVKQSPIPLPSMPGSPLKHCLALPSLPSTSTLAPPPPVRARSLSAATRLQPTPPPPSSPTISARSSLWPADYSMSSAPSALKQFDARHLSEALRDVSPRGGRRPSIPLPEIGYVPVSPKRRRTALDQ